MNSTLFGPEDRPPLAARLAPALRSLADQGVYLGTSSWKYPGWVGSVYSESRYLTRKKFSKAKFEAECLKEYAQTFPTVGGDFSFYKFPTAYYWAGLFADTPPDFTFALKVPEDVTVLRWPTHPRYGARAGLQNEHFLDADLFQEALLQPLVPYRRQVAVLMLEFGTFARTKDFATPADFLQRLDQFLTALPPGWPYAVEVRNKEYLGKEYFGVLKQHNVAHVLNAWTRMPTLAEQVEMPGVFTADFIVVRALLQHGRAYEQSVDLFEPYKEVLDPDPSTRAALRKIIEQAKAKKKRAYAYVNNRLEGNAPSTIAAVVLGDEK